MDGRGDAEALHPTRTEELRMRAARIRDRSKELVAALRPDQPLVAQAIERAEYLKR